MIFDSQSICSTCEGLQCVLSNISFGLDVGMSLLLKRRAKKCAKKEVCLWIFSCQIGK